MLETFRGAFKVKEIRERLVYTFFMLIVIRLGSQLPCPGIDSALFAEWFSSQTNGAFNFLMRLPADRSMKCLYLH